MNNEKELSNNLNIEAPETDDRREALKKLGKFSAYVAPFTVLALSKKAQAGSLHTGGPSHK
jgi:hypothetical protein